MWSSTTCASARRSSARAAPPARVLDVGCGTGALAAAAGRGRLRGDRRRSVGGDARGHARAPSSDRSRAGAGRACRSMTTASTWCCVAAMHHIAEPGAVRQTLAEMVRVTRPGGRILIWDHNPRNPYWGRLMARVPQDTGEERLIGPTEIVGGLNAAGASIVQCTQLGFVPDFIPPRAIRAAARLSAGSSAPRCPAASPPTTWSWRASARSRGRSAPTRDQLGHQPVGGAVERHDAEAPVDRARSHSTSWVPASIGWAQWPPRGRGGLAACQRLQVDQDPLARFELRHRRRSFGIHTDGTRPSAFGSPTNIRFTRRLRIRISVPRSGSRGSSIITPLRPGMYRLSRRSPSGARGSIAGGCQRRCSAAGRPPPG